MRAQGLRGARLLLIRVRSVHQPRLRQASTMTYQGSDSTADGLGPRDEQLLRVFLTASNHQWQDLPATARAALDAGCSAAELRATVRHLPM